MTVAVAPWLAELGAAVRAAHPATIAGMAAAFAAGALYACWRAQRSLRRARMIEDIPTAKVRSAPQGYVELEGIGKLLEGPPILAPLSGLPCVWYRYRVEKRQERRARDGLFRTHWVTAEHGTSTEIFCLDDGSGRVIVDPEGAEVTPRHKETWYGHGRNPGGAVPPAAVAALMQRHAAGGAYRFIEERINQGEKIYALGLLKNAGSHIGAPDVREQVGALLHKWKQDQAELKQRFDLDRDDRIDEREWQLVRSQARREVLKTQEMEQQQIGDAINVLRPTGDPSRPYLLSAYPQSRLIQRYRRGALGYVLLFFAAGSAALWLFNARFRG